MWNMALTPLQLTTGSTNGFSGNEPGLLGYWKFSEGSGANSFDLTSGQYTGSNISTLYSTDVGYNAFVDTDQDGVPDSYDDYPSDPQRAFNNYFPSSDVNTLAFEDLWPTRGDYDFNDLVVSYRLNTITNAQGMVVETFGDFTLHAIGGSFRNGFGFNLPGSSIPINQITCTGSALYEDYITLNSQGLEDYQQFPTVIVFDNAYRIMPGQTGSTGVNVTPGVPYITPATVQIHLTYPAGTYTLAQLGMSSFNPFMIINKSRFREVHLPDRPPTSYAEPALFGTQDDDSDPSLNRYYKTSNNLPWAICVPGVFAYPFEKADVLTAHLKMASWALSSGNQYADWYLDLPGYRDNSKIY
jgi:LruC domain-containing protein